MSDAATRETTPAEKPAARILVVDDDASHRAMLEAVLAAEGYAVEAAAGGREALERLSREPADVVLLDIRMAEMDGIEVLAGIGERWPDLPVVMMTAYASVETAVGALKRGARDYLTKPLDIDELKLTVARVLEHQRLRRENRELRARLHSEFDFGGIVSASPAMERVLDTLRKVAPTDATLFILGESGTGKELAANAVHQGSPRAGGPFVAVNCAALPDQLLESELFGYEKGAFTGAVARRRGKAEEAHGGTLFLDEVAEMSPALQAKLLRFLQEREVQPLGGAGARAVDTRVVAATNRDPAAMVAEGSFREDLYYRLNVVSVRIPPLRERIEDIPLLAERFRREFAGRYGRDIPGISPEAQALILEYPWPGNVRELENAIERAVVLAAPGELTPGDLPPEVTGLVVERRREEGFAVEMTLREAEAAFIRRVLAHFRGNKSRAAKSLGISRQTLLNKLAQEN